MRRTVCATAIGLIGHLPVAFAESIFHDVTEDAGLEFEHYNGMTGELYFVEMMGSGGAFLDFDNDGDLDIYLVQGNVLDPGKTASDENADEPAAPSFKDRLYRNDTRGDDGVVRYTDVTESSGIRAHGYGMGVAVGDVNNDGLADIYVTNYGPNQLWLNRGGGRFEDGTRNAGGADNRWSVSAAFVDYDRDGLLDLYVGNYVNYTFANHKPCRSSTSARDYCSPLVYQPVTDRLLHNRGNGVFEDVSRSSGISGAEGGALGVITADFNDDTWIDIYVANDGVPNQLWINKGNGKFSDEAVFAGVAVNMDGRPEASMGVDAADFDGDGDVDLFMTHLARETNTLYVNDGTGWFEDRTIAVGLAGASFPFTGFGTGWFDFDNDGRLDILSVNGAVTRIETQLDAGDPHPLKQSNQLFRNVGNGAYEEVSAAAGPAFSALRVSRGAAFGDFDNDGDTDVLVTNNGGPARLLENRVGQDRSWIGIELEPGPDKKTVVGARVGVVIGDRSQWRRVRRDGSYASANDDRIIFGLDDQREPVTVRVRRPGGELYEWRGLATGRYHTLRLDEGLRVTGD